MKKKHLTDFRKTDRCPSRVVQKTAWRKKGCLRGVHGVTGTLEKVTSHFEGRSTTLRRLLIVAVIHPIVRAFDGGLNTLKRVDARGNKRFLEDHVFKRSLWREFTTRLREARKSTRRASRQFEIAQTTVWPVNKTISCEIIQTKPLSSTYK